MRCVPGVHCHKVELYCLQFKIIDVYIYIGFKELFSHSRLLNSETVGYILKKLSE